MFLHYTVAYGCEEFLEMLAYVDLNFSNLNSENIRKYFL